MLTSRPLDRRPPWPRKKLVYSAEVKALKEILRASQVRTVCEDAKCPNISDCFGRREATFIILGDVCTRRCSFCAIPTGKPAAPDPTEPERLAQAARDMGLRHAVITSVTRDDLPDGGSTHFAECINAIRTSSAGTTIEVLTPDFKADHEALQRIADTDIQIYNHNIETVPSLQASIRPQARYDRSLHVLEHFAAIRPDVLTKSGLMLGFGESDEEVETTMQDLRNAGVQILTVGQYMQPLGTKDEVFEYIPMERFDELRELGESMGFLLTLSGPYVRSSFGAADAAASLGIQRLTTQTDNS